MKQVKNVAVGFLVSFLGSIPLGYLNVVGYEIYKISGIKSVIPYLFGVISVEVFVIYFTLIFANQLMQTKKLLQFIEGFSVLFMFILAGAFYFSAKGAATDQSVFAKYSQYAPYFMGLILSGFNIIQLPFWVGWNLYLLNGNYIEVTRNKKYFYIFGTLLGTFTGMLGLILSLNYITSKTDFLANYLMLYIIPVVFLMLGIYQGIQFYRKFYR
jgi:hypothetical protein